MIAVGEVQTARAFVLGGGGTAFFGAPLVGGGVWGGFGSASAGESSADLDAEISSLRVAGRTHRQICDALGVSRGRVARALGSGPVAGEAKSDAPPAVSGGWVSLAE